MSPCPLDQLVPRGRVGFVGFGGSDPVALQFLPVGTVAAAVHFYLARMRVDLHDLPRHPFEERAVVRHDDEAAAEAREMTFEQLQAGQVQVVGRLVKQQHVESGQQHRRER